MSLARPRVARGGMVDEVLPGDLLAAGENLTAGALTTAGDGTWLAASVATGFIRRTGPGGAYTDTSPTSADIITALGGSSIDAVPGTSFRLIFQNTVAFAMTFTAGTGIKTGTGTLTVAASLVREYLLTILNASPPVTLQATTINASKVITFVLPAGMTAWPVGPAPNAVNITPGMIVSGTGIAASTYVDGLTMGPGGITGVHVDTNATATSASTGVALTFNPVILIDGIRSSTL